MKIAVLPGDGIGPEIVNEAVKGLKLTKVIVAHRPDTIASADRVLVMEQGRIVQELRPKELGPQEPQRPRIPPEPALAS